jgi:hypothetical protein
MNLGSLFPLVSNYIVNLNTQTNINLKDSEKVSGTTEASFTADELRQTSQLQVVQ